MDELPAEQCQVIELAYFGGFTHTEIAEMLDAPVGTVKGRMRLGPEEDARPARRRGGDALMQRDPITSTGTTPRRLPAGRAGRDERAAFEEHLAGCPACREEVDELLPAADALPISVEPMARRPR